MIKGIVSEAFTHSIEVYVTVERENLSSSKREMTNNGWLTFVAVDKSGALIQVPELRVSNEDEKSRKLSAKDRKTARVKEKEDLARILF